MTFSEGLSLLIQALQAIVPATQWLGVFLGALAYWVIPSQWRLRALLPISLLVVALGYNRWPLLPLLAIVLGAAVYVATPVCIRRTGAARAVIIAVTAIFCLLHGLLGLLTFTDVLAFTGVTDRVAIAQCGTVVLFGYLRLIHWIVDRQRLATATILGTSQTGDPSETQVWNFLSWLVFFPTFTSLPLVRSQEFSVMQSHTLERRHIVRGIKHAAQLLIKSILIAGMFTQVSQVSAIYRPFEFGVQDVWIGLIVNTLIFFLGFTGYVDFALFAGCMLGFDLPDNFARCDRLLLNGRARDFWRDWNYTVTRWLKDYIYIPLGGIRKHPQRNTLLTMIFCGLWHSVSILGALWGVMLGGMMLAEHWWTRARIKGVIKFPQAPLPVRAVLWLVAFGVVQMAQVPFAYTTENIGGLFRLYGRMIGAG